MRSTSHPFTLTFTAMLLAACGGSKNTSTTVTSLAYSHNSNNRDDVTKFVNVYPQTVGTRLDSCQTCHKSFVFSSTKSTGEVTYTTKSVCDYCHLVDRPDMKNGVKVEYDQPQPASYAETLNAYGLAYSQKGRSQKALRDIAGEDSDGDTYSNSDEIAAGRYPGDTASHPGLAYAPAKILTVEDLKAMTPVHSEFLLSNSQKQQYDNYATYKGIKIRDLLTAVGVDPDDSNIISVTVVAPDMFAKDFSRKAAEKGYWFDDPFDPGLFYGGLGPSNPPDGLGPTCGFVQYPTTIPDGITDGGTIPDEQWLMLAYERDGVPVTPAYLDTTSLRLNEEGPLRLIVPQAIPGRPDRGQNASKCNDGYDYDGNLDHNAGFAVRGVIAIKINGKPEAMPAYEDFDYMNGAYKYLENNQIVVTGYGIQ